MTVEVALGQKPVASHSRMYDGILAMLHDLLAGARP